MVVGKAHAPQMSSATRTQWRDGLGHNRSANLDAPNWLWSSIVELVASHEVAYLEALSQIRGRPGVSRMTIRTALLVNSHIRN